MKSLKPSMKENKRYILLRGNFSKEDAEKAILRYIGILGYAKASPMFVSKNVLAVNRSELEKVKASFALVQEIKIEKISGTLKGLGKR
jgi:RNase P/RNase MRP subunit POP5